MQADSTEGGRSGPHTEPPGSFFVSTCRDSSRISDRRAAASICSEIESVNFWSVKLLGPRNLHTKPTSQVSSKIRTINGVN